MNTRKQKKISKNQPIIKIVRLETLEAFGMFDVAKSIQKRKLQKPIIKIKGHCKRCNSDTILFQKFLCHECLSRDFSETKYLQDRGYLLNYNKGVK